MLGIPTLEHVQRVRHVTHTYTHKHAAFLNDDDDDDDDADDGNDYTVGVVFNGALVFGTVCRCSPM